MISRYSIIAMIQSYLLTALKSTLLPPNRSSDRSSIQKIEMVDLQITAPYFSIVYAY